MVNRWCMPDSFKHAASQNRRVPARIPTAPLRKGVQTMTALPDDAEPDDLILRATVEALKRAGVSQ
jgi:hypothetical protein